jgi:hypothetical protein
VETGFARAEFSASVALNHELQSVIISCANVKTLSPHAHANYSELVQLDIIIIFLVNCFYTETIPLCMASIFQFIYLFSIQLIKGGLIQMMNINSYTS